MNAGRESTSLSAGQVVFVVSVLTAAVFLMGWTAWRYIIPPPPPRDIAAEARQLWSRRTPVPLTRDLGQLLEKNATLMVDSEKHPLIGKTAPEFALVSHRDEQVQLRDLTRQGPVVVVFYLGYGCDHCVAQLFGIQQDLKFFKELGAQVVAISDDTTEHTRTQYARHGAFPFPVLSDPRGEVAGAWKVNLPVESKPGDVNRRHGTFVVSQEGTIVWGSTGEEPFFHNPTLLSEIAKLTRRIESTEPPRQPGSVAGALSAPSGVPAVTDPGRVRAASN
jgi:peroxiredoxin